MASTYSGLKLQLMATGENAGTWGDITNTNLGTALEEAIAGTTDVTFDSADVTLTLTDTNTTQVARHMRLNLTGTTGGARSLIVPATEKLYVINNGCADAITVKNSASTGTEVPAGKSMFVYNDGTEVSAVVTFSPGGVESADTWTTARTFTIGDTGKSVDGSANVTWTLNELGAQEELVSGTNIKTINGNSVLGSGNLEVGGGSGTITAVTATSPLNSSGGTAPNISLTGTVAISNGGTGSTTASGARSNLELGSMAQQNASNVDINGGDVTGLSDFSVTGGEAVFNPSNASGRTLVVGDTSSDSSTWNAYIKGQNGAYPALNVTSGINSNSIGLEVVQQTVGGYLIWFSHPSADTNIGGVTVASSSTVAFVTSSDYRLKTDVVPMTSAVERVNNLNPVRFKWVSEPENPAVDGFLAHEVSPVVPEAIHGEKDAVNEDGSIKPQGIDQSKLVPLLVGAVQELSARVETLEAKVAVLEAT